MGVAALSTASSGQCIIRQHARITGAEGACGLSGCRFGYGVAISGDGNTAAMGAQGDNSFQGAVYFFARSGQDWVQQGPKFLPGDGQGTQQNFGCSVALSGDGNTAVVGAYGDNSSVGAAYIFVRDNGSWTQQGPKLVPTNNIGQLGYFGIASAMSYDGNTVVIGAEGDAGYAGAAYVFRRSGGVWTQEAKFTSIGGIGVTQYFGSAVAISGDGLTVGVGARGDNNFRGAAYMFVRTPGTSNWSNQGGKLVPTNILGTAQYFGSSIALSGDGNVALIGAYADNNFAGAVFNYNRFGVNWFNQQKFAPLGATGNSRYGSSVAISADGTVALVGAHADAFYAGAAYKCVRTNGWSQPDPKIVPTGTAGPGTFGFSVALSSAGDRSIIGSYTEGLAAGAAYSFDLCARVMATCRADFDGQGGVTPQDIFEFLNAWFAADARADFDAQGGITPQDIFEYLNAWFAGCP